MQGMLERMATRLTILGAGVDRVQKVLQADFEGGASIRPKQAHSHAVGGHGGTLGHNGGFIARHAKARLARSIVLSSLIPKCKLRVLVPLHVRSRLQHSLVDLEMHDKRQCGIQVVRAWLVCVCAMHCAEMLCCC